MSRALLGLLPTSPRFSPRAQGHDADRLERRLVPLPAQHFIGPAICGPHCLVHNSCHTSVAGEGTRRLGVGRGTFLRIQSFSRIGEHFRFAYAQMLSSLLEMLSPTLKCYAQIKLFGWLLLRQRLMMRSLRQRFYPNAPVECPLCAGAAENCSHLFFECQFAQVALPATPTYGLVTSSTDSF